MNIPRILPPAGFRRLLTLALVAALASLLALPPFPARAEAPASSGKVAPPPAGRFRVGGEILARHESWNWFEGAWGRNDYDYPFQRTRIDLRSVTPDLSIHLQPQYVRMFGVPDDAFAPGVEGPLGMGALYRRHGDDDTPNGFALHQASVTFGGSMARDRLRLGRFEYADGLEALHPADGTRFNMLKNMRLSDRMISAFDWSAFGRAFDGAEWRRDTPRLNFTAAFLVPTQGGWEDDAHRSMSDVTLTPLTLTFRRGVLAPGTEFAFFYYNFRDERAVTQRVDNSGTALSPGGVDIDLDMYGARALGSWDVRGGAVDALLWGGVQKGDWYELDHDATAFAAELGFQFTRARAKPWLRVGYYRGSGDANPADGEHGTFFQMAPGTRKFNLLPYWDLMNSEDRFVQFLAFPSKKLKVRAEYHNVKLAEAADRWYMGSGPTRNEGAIFGYIGRPTGGREDLAHEASLMLQYQARPDLTFAVDYTRVKGGGVVRNVYGVDDRADYLSLQTALKF